MTAKSAEELVADAKTRIKEVRVHEVKDMRDRKEAFTLIDVREPMEWNLGRIPGAVHIPLGMLESKVEGAAPRDARVVLYCARGNRSALAADTLQNLGYSNVSSMAGGWLAWAQEVGEVED
jgi:rhodanese-related sulfurtransferase